jgi:hypothetical protein
MTASEFPELGFDGLAAIPDEWLAASATRSPAACAAPCATNSTWMRRRHHARRHPRH